MTNTQEQFQVGTKWHATKHCSTGGIVLDPTYAGLYYHMCIMHLLQFIDSQSYINTKI